MPGLMRCLYCGLLQDEPVGVKECQRCGGELAYENAHPYARGASYIDVQMELDQVRGPAGRMFDRHLLVTLCTPDQVPAEHTAQTVSGRPPLSFIAVLDVSGSMAGEKLANAKEAVRQALRRLHEGDSLSLVTFSDRVRCVLEPTKFKPDVTKVVESALAEINSGGMTALCSGLELGIEKARRSRRDATLVLLLSDGQANIGETDLEKVGQRGYHARQENILVSTIGIGADYNEALMAEIATQSGGRFYHVLSPGQIIAYLTGELGEVAALAARQAVLELDIPPGSVIMPFTAAYPVQQRAGRAAVELGDLPSALELEIPLRLTLPAQPLGTKLSFAGELNYNSPAGKILSTALNRVTVRYVDPAQFDLRDGVVTPVVERVLSQMKAAQVLDYSRAMARGPADADRAAHLGITALREYASLLGEDRAERESEESSARLGFMASSPLKSKNMVADAYSGIRASKKFDKKDKQDS